MKAILFCFLVCIGVVALAVDVSWQKAVEESIQGIDEKANLPVPTEQERIDTIVRAFKHLPAPELDRLDVDISVPIFEKTVSAENLLKAWERRQAELREAMSGMMKPAEMMTDIAKDIQNLTSDSRIQSLKNLESLLEDIDNSRDFHTMGFWPVLPRALLMSEYSLEEKVLLLQCIGNAVKNSYDYQLWLLEPVTEENDTTLSILVDSIAAYSGVEEMSQEALGYVKSALYALFSGIRGNVDVQQHINKHLAMPNPSSISATVSESEATAAVPSSEGVCAASADSAAVAVPQNKFYTSLQQLLLSTQRKSFDTLPIQRKLWSFLRDMLEEAEYIRKELNVEELKSIQHAQKTGSMHSADTATVAEAALNDSKQTNDNDSTADSAADVAEVLENAALSSALESIRGLSLIGDGLYNNTYFPLAYDTINTIEYCIAHLRNATTLRNSEVAVDGEGKMAKTMANETDNRQLRAILVDSLRVWWLLADCGTAGSREAEVLQRMRSVVKVLSEDAAFQDESFGELHPILHDLKAFLAFV